MQPVSAWAVLQLVRVFYVQAVLRWAVRWLEGLHIVYGVPRGQVSTTDRSIAMQGLRCRQILANGFYCVPILSLWQVPSTADAIEL